MAFCNAIILMNVIYFFSFLTLFLYVLKRTGKLYHHTTCHLKNNKKYCGTKKMRKLTKSRRLLKYGKNVRLKKHKAFNIN